MIPQIVNRVAMQYCSGLGSSLRTVDLVGTTSYDEIVARVARFERVNTASSYAFIGAGITPDTHEWPHQIVAEALSGIAWHDPHATCCTSASNWTRRALTW